MSRMKEPYTDSIKIKPMFNGTIVINSSVKVNGSTIIHKVTGRFQIPQNNILSVLRNNEQYSVTDISLNQYELIHCSTTTQTDDHTYLISRKEMQSLFEQGKIKVKKN